MVVTCHRDTSLAGATRFVVNRSIFCSLLDVVYGPSVALSLQCVRYIAKLRFVSGVIVIQVNDLIPSWFGYAMTAGFEIAMIYGILLTAGGFGCESVVPTVSIKIH